MPSALSPQEFVAKWRSVSLKEKSAAQSHFNDLCALLGVETPTDADPRGIWYTFEAGAQKLGGGEGFADVWRCGYFAWEYKGKHADLDKAYEQLLQYREALQNPPLLIVSDTDRILVHTNFTNTAKRVFPFTLDDLLDAGKRDLLRAAWLDSERFKAAKTTEHVTTEAAARFAELANLLRKYGAPPEAVARFLIRLLFCLFAEDARILPGQVFSQLARKTRSKPRLFAEQLGQLFQTMATGGMFALEEVPRFDGGLFNDSSVLEMDSEGMQILTSACDMDWSSIEPSILGTLFERGLDPSKRSQLGAHYTSRDDILLIVEPVLMAPLRKRWAEVEVEARDLATRRDAAGNGQTREKWQRKLRATLTGFAHELARIQVLDPACGSGNFLYVALRQLLDLWKQVSTRGKELGLPLMMPMEGESPNPSQLHGVEINLYAHELAQATIWIGYLQWLRENGFGDPSEPILKPIETVRQMDAILAYDDQGRPVEPEWPAADVIIGNPPFLGGGKIRAELGDKYTEALFKLYGDRIPNFSDLVCYWFEKARAMIQRGRAKRAGLLATQGIRGGANRRVLERITQAGNIFWAQSDRDWILEGATVHVSMIGFDAGAEQSRELDGRRTESISAALQSGIDITRVCSLPENAGLAFIGDTKKGKFDISGAIAAAMLAAPPNPNGRSNADVVKPWINGLDLTGRPRGMYIIDFGVNATQAEASLYEKPFEYVRERVKPDRDKVRNLRERRLWWIHGRAAPDLRLAVKGLQRYIATPRVSKHRLFVYVSALTLPDGQVVVVALDDDYSLGLLQSAAHELWSRAVGTQLRDSVSGFRYSQTLTFETFPFPWPPGKEPNNDPRVEAIALAAHELVQQRDAWLNPAGASDQELQRRTLTNLYNQRPTWLQLAHQKLDVAVFVAYGWPADLPDDEVLRRLLELNLERAAP